MPQPDIAETAAAATPPYLIDLVVAVPDLLAAPAGDGSIAGIAVSRGVFRSPGRTSQ
jgi:hypothetical protein